jgi:hypothetical protein
MPREDLIPILLITAVFVGICVAVLRSLFGRSSPTRSPSFRAADGEVELLPMAGLPRVANGARIDIGRFDPDGSFDRSRRRPLVPSHVAPRLLGEVRVWLVFLGRDGTDWSDEEIALGCEATLRAAKWLENEAVRWKAGVNLSLASVYFSGQDASEEDVEVGFQFAGDEVGPREGHAETKLIASASRMASGLGFASLVDLVESMQAWVEADAQAWIVHVRRQGQSFAVAPDLTPIPGLSLACCYLRESSFSEPIGLRTFAADPVTVAHELLHLFGASDKYGTSLQSFPEGSTTRRDIMRLEVERLSQLRIDRLTASELGWV